MAGIKDQLAAAYAEAQHCLLDAAQELRGAGKLLESGALHNAFATLTGADLMKMMFAQDDPLDQRYVEEGLASLRSLPEQVRLENWENVIAVANGFAALTSAPPVKFGKLTNEAETAELEDVENFQALPQPMPSREAGCSVPKRPPPPRYLQ